MSHDPTAQPVPQARPALLQQAPVVPLDASGFTAAIVGTILFVIATVLAWQRGVTGQWLYILITGTILGVLLVGFTGIHRWRRSRANDADQSLEH
ncbi:MAG: DUF2530 domain-containing protein [Propionibacteriaceae bacterium]|nr:DUF2530 domain-containing protein [Propionibacteriaceae bacterium]